MSSKFSYILDCRHTIYVWFGQFSSTEERNAASSLAEEMWKMFHRPNVSESKIIVMKQEKEVTEFKKIFGDSWNQEYFQIESTFSSSNSSSSLSAEIVDVSLMLLPRDPFFTGGVLLTEHKPLISFSKQKLSSITQEGIFQMWTISPKGKWIALREDEHSLLCDAKSYVCLYIFTDEEKMEFSSVIYFWEGLFAPITHYLQFRFSFLEKLLAKLKNVHPNPPKQLRILQNKESHDFLSIFGGRLIIHKANFPNQSGLFQVKGNVENTRATQLSQFSSHCLNSGDCFLVVVPSNNIYVWFGKGSNEIEREWASIVGEKFLFQLPCKQIERIEEGEEPKAFWELLGGKKPYALNHQLESPEQPHLFEIEFTSEISIRYYSFFSEIDLKQVRKNPLFPFFKI